LLDAVWEELRAVGYYHLTFDGVAARAGTSKAVLYRRWINRLELVRAALRMHRPLISGTLPNTGSLRGDVIALLEHIALGLNELQPDIVWGILTDAISSSAQSDILQGQVHQTNAAAMERILEQAEVRGEVRSGDIPPRVMTVPFDLARHEMVMTGRPATTEAIVQIVDEIFLPLVMRTRQR
jgi:AcrR family transcriptional regulator